MGDIVAPYHEDGAISLLVQADDYVPQKCIFINCKEAQTFPTKASLKYANLSQFTKTSFCSHPPRRHQDKHTRPYICHQQPCANKSFGDKAGLQRHEREVHSSKTDAHTCPFPSCKRNKRGFHRRYNLLEHQKRAHGLQPDASPTAVNNSDGFLERENSHGFQGEIGRESGGSDIPERALSGIIQGNGNTGTEQDLIAKLHRLEDIRAEIDEDITSLKRVLSIMGGGSL
jgi:hypothetical protein